MSVLILILGLVHAAALLAAIQSIYEFPNINSSSKQLAQRHPGLPYTSKCSKSDKISYAHPPQVFLSQILIVLSLSYIILTFSIDPGAITRGGHTGATFVTWTKSVVDTARSGPEPCQFHSSGVGVAQISKRW